MPTNFMDLKKLLRGEGYAQIFHRLENCWRGGMPTNFMYLKKCWWGGGGGGYAKIFYGFEKKCWGGGYANKLMDLKNVEGGRVMPTYFRDLKKMLGGGGVMPKYFIDLKNVGGGGVCQQILWT